MSTHGVKRWCERHDCTCIGAVEIRAYRKHESSLTRLAPKPVALCDVHWSEFVKQYGSDINQWLGNQFGNQYVEEEAL